jgi:hypothetical protein
MTVEKQHQIGAPKAKVAGGKDDDVLLTTGDVMVIGVGGDAKLISAKAMGIDNDPQAGGILIGHTVKVDPKTGHLVLGQKIEKTHLPTSAGIVVGESAMVSPKALGIIVEVDRNTGHLVVRSQAKKGNKSYSAAEALIARSGGVEDNPSAAEIDFDTTPKVISGTGEEVVRVLDRTPGARFVAVRIENQNEEQVAAAENVFARVAEFLPQLIETRQEETLKKFVDTLLPSVTPSAAARAQAQMLIAARSSILQSGDFITAKEVSKLAGYSETNPSVYPNKWKRSGKIFAIQSEGKDYFPFYALDPNNKYQPREEVADVLRIFGDSKDSWGIALWFASLNSFLDDERPQDTLAIDPSRVAAAAEDEMAGIQHG